MPFLVIFIGISLLEITVFASLGEEIGLFNTLFLAILTAVIGGALVRHQGFETLRSMMSKGERGQMPAEEIFDGLCILIAGATLITPGFLTDIVGFLLLVPAFRRAIKGRIIKVSKWEETGHYRQEGPDVIEGEFEQVKNEPPEPK